MGRVSEADATARPFSAERDQAKRVTQGSAFVEKAFEAALAWPGLRGELCLKMISLKGKYFDSSPF